MEDITDLAWHKASNEINEGSSGKRSSVRVQTILEAISDILAVPPAGIALITGPILFEIISVDYYNQLVVAFPAVPNGYVTDLNIALGGIGARLSNTSNVFLGDQPLQAALGNLRSSLGSLGTVQGTLQGLIGSAA